MPDTNVVLFKATKGVNPITKYYAESTKYNHLDDVLKKKNFKVIKMDCTHDLWIKDDVQVTKICNLLVNMCD